MRNPAVGLATWLAAAASRQSHSKILATLNVPEKTQTDTLRAITDGLSRSEYGRQHALASRADYEEFAARIPIAKHEDFADELSRMLDGDADVLWPGRPRSWRMTSGSSGPRKEIPVTGALEHVFTRFILAWCHDVLMNAVRIRHGKLFMSLSPSIDEDDGLLDDTAYAGGAFGWLLKRFLIAPGVLSEVRCPQAFRLILATALVAEPKLEVISIWNPSYLLVLMDTISRNRDQILASFSANSMNHEGLRLSLPPLSQSRERAILQEDWQTVWPDLQFVSCWADASAAAPAARLAERLPHAIIQPKGLISTEAPVSLPIAGSVDPVAFTSGVFLEFMDGDGRIFRAHEVAAGQEYRVIVSPLGGFPRYDLGDRVRITGHHQKTPTLRFIGRGDDTSDMVGEKLQEPFVRKALDTVLGARPACLIAVFSDQPPCHYLLVSEGVGEPDASAVDLALSESVRYREARQNGQLAPVALLRTQDARLALIEFMEARGMRWGDIKDRALLPHRVAADRAVKL